MRCSRQMEIEIDTPFGWLHDGFYNTLRTVANPPIKQPYDYADWFTDWLDEYSFDFEQRVGWIIDWVREYKVDYEM